MNDEERQRHDHGEISMVSSGEDEEVAVMDNGSYNSIDIVVRATPLSARHPVLAASVQMQGQPHAPPCT